MSAAIADTTAPGTPVQTPPAAPDRLADVHAVIAELESKSTGKGPGAAPEAPAAPAQPASPAKVEPGKDTAPSKETAAPAAPAPEATPAAPAKVPYTQAEFDAFAGNFHDRNFDWDRWPEHLKDSKEFARSVASGYGKRHATLEAKLRADLQAELGATPKPPQPQPATGTPAAAEVELTAEQMTEAQELLATPGRAFEGLKILLTSKQGRELAASLGYADPTVREIVDERILDRNITQAIANIAEDFPAYLSDEAYRGEVGAVFDENPLLTAKVQGRDAAETTWAFAVANAIATTKRFSARETSLASREAALVQRETAVTAKEKDLERQIEATTRNEPKSPSLTPQASGNGAGTRVSSVDEAREVMRSVGMPV